MKARIRTRVRVRRPPDLTSLFDVLFIVVFVALIRAAAAEQALAKLEAAEPPPAPPPPAAVAAPGPPPRPLPLSELRQRALGQLTQELATRTPLVVRIAPGAANAAALWRVEAIEADGASTPLDAPLLERHPDPDVAVTYLGERSAALRVCRLTALHLRRDDLARYLVILAPARPLADLPHALVEGLKNDLVRCAAEQQGTAVIVEPASPGSPAPDMQGSAAP